MSELSFNITFCDDVRREADGRFSMMGVFEGIRVLPAHVKSLPKVTACAIVSAPPGFDLTQVELRLTVRRDGKIEHEDRYPDLPATAEIDASLARAAADAEASFRLKAYYAGLVELQNFPVHGLCSIKITGSHCGKDVFEHEVLLVADDDMQNDPQLVKEVVTQPHKSRRR